MWRLRPITSMKIHSPLSSISAFSTELKRMQTPGVHTVCSGILEHIKVHYQTFTTRCSGCRVQVWVQVLVNPVSADYLAITSEGYHDSRRQSMVLTAKWMAELLGPSSGTAWACPTGEHWRFQIGCSCCWQWQACRLSDSCEWPTLTILTWFESQRGFNAL